MDPAAPEITDHVDEVPPPQQLGGQEWDYTGRSNYDPCAALSYALVEVRGGTASSPVRVMLFHDGVYIGPETECAFAFTTVISATAESVTVEYRWPREGDPNAAPSGRATVTYRWTGETVQREGELPTELLQVNGCG